MADLFSAAAPARLPPLAEAMRPRTIDEVVGQDAVLGPGTPLRARIEAGMLGAVCLFGPPGVGKTTIARLVGAAVGGEWRPFVGAELRAEDVRGIAAEAGAKRLCVFVDEIHRLRADGQDSLLALAERRVIDLVVATTENPFHVLTKGLSSRSAKFRLVALGEAEVAGLAARAAAASTARGYPVTLGGGVTGEIARRSLGDARVAVTAVEDLALMARSTGRRTAMVGDVDLVFATQPHVSDRAGDGHYDLASAFIKSMRGSDPDAVLYYLARMVDGGEDPRFIARRIVIHASEDVGLADPTALQVAVAACEAVAWIGWPEAATILAHAALHVARAPKSNSAARGIARARALVESGAHHEVPPSLRDGHYAGAAELGHVGYRFPHDEASGWVDVRYAPGVPRGSLYESDGRDGVGWEAWADAHWLRVTGAATPARFPADRDAGEDLCESQKVVRMELARTPGINASW